RLQRMLSRSVAKHSAAPATPEPARRRIVSERPRAGGDRRRTSPRASADKTRGGGRVATLHWRESAPDHAISPARKELSMLRITRRPATAAVTAEPPLATAGRHLARYGLVVVIAWIGALKYTSYEATAIQPLIAHSPLLSWLYTPFSVRTFAAVLGT